MMAGAHQVRHQQQPQQHHQPQVETTKATLPLDQLNYTTTSNNLVRGTTNPMTPAVNAPVTATTRGNKSAGRMHQPQLLQQQQHPNCSTNKTAAILRLNHSITSCNEFLVQQQQARMLKKKKHRNLNSNNNNDNDVVNYNEPHPTAVRRDYDAGRAPMTMATTQQQHHQRQIICDKSDRNNNNNRAQISSHHHQHQQHQQQLTGQWTTTSPSYLCHHQSNGDAAAAVGKEHSSQATMVVSQQASNFIPPSHPPPAYQMRSSSNSNCGAVYKHQEVAVDEEGKRRRVLEDDIKRKDIDHWEQVSVSKQGQRRLLRRTYQGTRTEAVEQQHHVDVEQGFVYVLETRPERMGPGGGGVEDGEKVMDEDGDADAGEDVNEQEAREERGSRKPIYRQLVNYIRRLRRAWSGISSAEHGKRNLQLIILDCV